MTFQKTPLAPNYGVEVHDIDLTQINSEMAEAILDTVSEHALLLFRRQSLHDADIYALSAALGPVEEPAARINHSPRFKEVNYISNLNNPQHIYQHNYRMGDMLIYDNAQLLHKRDAYKGPRFLKITRVFLFSDRFAVPD